jgi:hypothetical protein
MPEPRNRIDPSSVLAAAAVGIVLVLMVIFGPMPSMPEGAGTSVLRALMIYFPTGFLAGRFTRLRHRDGRLAPPAIHAFLSGTATLLAHLALLYTAHEELLTAIAWILAEALFALAIATSAGLIGGYRKGNNTMIS